MFPLLLVLRRSAGSGVYHGNPILVRWCRTPAGTCVSGVYLRRRSRFELPGRCRTTTAACGTGLPCHWCACTHSECGIVAAVAVLRLGAGYLMFDALAVLDGMKTVGIAQSLIDAVADSVGHLAVTSLEPLKASGVPPLDGLAVRRLLTPRIGYFLVSTLPCLELGAPVEFPPGTWKRFVSLSGCVSGCNVVYGVLCAVRHVPVC